MELERNLIGFRATVLAAKKQKNPTNSIDVNKAVLGSPIVSFALKIKFWSDSVLSNKKRLSIREGVVRHVGMTFIKVLLSFTIWNLSIRISISYEIRVGSSLKKSSES